MGEIALRLVKMAALLVAVWAATGASSYDHGITLSVAQTDPSLTASLSRNETLYIAVAYSSGQPIRVQAKAYFRGEPADKGQMMNPTVLHPAGRGTALVWVGFRDAARADRIEITAYNDAWDVLSRKMTPADLTWTATSMKVFPPPQWVPDLRRVERRLAGEYEEANRSSFLDLVMEGLGLLLFAAVPGYILLQAIALARFEGRWRLAAMAPLLLMGAAGVHAAIALAAGSNIWPLVVVLAAPFAVIYLGGLFSAKFLGAART